MRALWIRVTGGSGLLGRFGTQAVMGVANVRVLDLKPPVQDVSFHKADIRDPAAVAEAMAGVDTVIHLAAYDDGDALAEGDYITTNLVGAGPCSRRRRMPGCAGWWWHPARRLWALARTCHRITYRSMSGIG